MHFLKLLFIITLLTSCTNKRNAEIAKLKADHDARMNLMKVVPEPFYEKVPDSMKSWIPFFKTVYTDDQAYRIVGYDMTSEAWAKQKLLDSQNLRKVTTFPERYGWPAGFDFGYFGKHAAGMVIQHAPLKVQEKYYPSLVEAYKRDSFLFETLVLLEDRINMKNHRFQYYGSPGCKL